MEHLITGITIGITVSAINGIFLYVVKRSRVEQQRKLIREILRQHLDAILNAEPYQDEYQTYTEDQMRVNYYDSLWREINAYLSHKASEIHYGDELYIKRAFFNLNNLRAQQPDLPLGAHFFRKYLVPNLKELEWLNID